MKPFMLISLLFPFAICNHIHKANEYMTSGIQAKPGTEKNKLFSEYGTNFRYIGEVKNALDRVTVVTSIPIPKYTDIENL